MWEQIFFTLQYVNQTWWFSLNTFYRLEICAQQWPGIHPFWKHSTQITTIVYASSQQFCIFDSFRWTLQASCYTDMNLVISVGVNEFENCNCRVSCLLPFLPLLSLPLLCTAFPLSWIGNCASNVTLGFMRDWRIDWWQLQVPTSSVRNDCTLIDVTHHCYLLSIHSESRALVQANEKYKSVYIKATWSDTVFLHWYSCMIWGLLWCQQFGNVHTLHHTTIQ